MQKEVLTFLMPNVHISPPEGSQQAKSTLSKTCVMKSKMAKTELKEMCYGLLLSINT